MTQMPLIIGHRGSRSSGVRENSCEAIDRGVIEGADIIELDIVRAAGGSFVAHHYPFPNLRGNYLRAKPLSQIPYADSLESVLDTLASRRTLYLDIKEKLGTVDTGRLLGLIAKNHTNSLIVGSFHRSVLAAARDHDGQSILNYHCLPRFRAIREAICLGAHWINPIHYAIRKSFVVAAISEGLKFAPAGNENIPKQLRYASWGAHALSTFRPAYLRSLLEKQFQAAGGQSHE